MRSSTGNEEVSIGHCLFRNTDLDNAGITLQTGDVFTDIAEVTTDLEIMHVKYESPLNGNFLLVYTFFENRHDKRASR
jgi:hypothetical protein